MRKLILGFVLILIQAGLCSAAETSGGMQFSSTGSASEANPLPERPNIVFILLDDLDQQITPYWKAMPKTEALLADKGLTFEQSFSPNPICCPARATLLTGLCSHNTRVLTNTGYLGSWKTFVNPVDDWGNPILDEEEKPINNEERTLGVYLQQAGYKTMFTGKYLNDYSPDEDSELPPVPLGWTEWHVYFSDGTEGDSNKEAMPFYTGYDYDMVHKYEGLEPSQKHYPKTDSNGRDLRVENYSTDVLRELSVDFIQRQQGDAPLFMFINPTAPHAPLQAAPRHAEISKKWIGQLPKNPNFNEADVSDKSKWHRKMAPLLRPFMSVTKDRNHPLWKRMYFLFPELEFVDRMGSLYAVDDLVAGLVEALLKGRLESTIIVFASDNGYNLGAHVLIQKQTPYDEALRVPLVVMGPGVRQGKTQAIVSQQDYLPTFLDLAGVEIPDHVDGRSFKNVFFTDDKYLTYDQLDRDLLIESNVNGGELAAESAYPLTTQDKEFFLKLMPPSYRGLRTRDYAYIEWHLEPPHEYELYDMINDEWQLDNLLSTKEGKVKYRRLVRDLQNRLEELKNCKGEKCL